MERKTWWWLVVVVTLISMVGASVALAQKAPVPNGAPTSDPAPGQVTPLAVDTFDGRVEPVVGTDDRTHLAYELRLTNITAANLTFERVRVLDPSHGGRVVDELSGDELASRLVVFGNASDKRFGPGVAGFLFMDVTYPAGARLPDRLEYRFDVSTSKPTGLEDSFRAGPTRVGQEEPAQIGSPLFGKRWLAGEGCCETITSHRGAIFPIDGTFHAPERFAIDWVQVGKNGRLYEGPKDKLSSYPYYGAKIRSVAAGRVVGTRDTEPEQTPGQFPNGLALNDFGGNYVVVDIGDGRYAYYAHLQKGSKGVLVEPGDQVRKGEIIGKLGNTGNTDAPHLHFMIIDGKEPLTSGAVPFEIDSFYTRGVLTNYDAFLSGAKAEISPKQSGKQRDRLPLHRTVNDFR
ncbi:MAG TPA: M23 family metallopeptidase [Rubrobacter sp.]|nr:M23 family metallopeptidase [Rubrobacter sp.]